MSILKGKMELAKLNQNELNEEIALLNQGKPLGKSTLSELLNGNYKSGKKSEYEGIIHNILDLKIKENEESKVFWTHSQIAVRNRIRRIKDSPLSFLEHVCGESGTGKSFVFDDMVANCDRSLKMKVGQNQTVGGLMSMLLDSVEERTYGTMYDKQMRFNKAIKKKGINFIVIDEADLFCSDKLNMFSKKMEVFRDIYEYSKEHNLGVSVIVVGLPKLRNKINELAGYLLNRFTKCPLMIIEKKDIKSVAGVHNIKEEASLDYVASANNLRLVELVSNNMALGYDERLSINFIEDRVS